ncbi:hypothetical protein M413DRAFT_438935 [Hebeloma cylindrosporum]|uniref:Uncharacterized protein n=1 Tax=Hebeloma cylindrosporum TaxID=76867 RepID=A0A0C2YJ61_HEBCY|nr:hypothetical protein M413DRAFT_438935 [Hebeloma cylindrosporum h7]
MNGEYGCLVRLQWTVHSSNKEYRPQGLAPSLANDSQRLAHAMRRIRLRTFWRGSLTIFGKRYSPSLR